MRTAALVIVALVGCKSGHGPKDAPKEKECPKADQDPDYVHVDRDQLAALCLSSELPPLAYPSDNAALVLPDGTRTPWLLLWSNADQPLMDKQVSHAAEWLAAARARLERLRHGMEPAPPETPSGKQWLNILCRGDEAHRVVITGALFEAKGAHAIAIRGDQVLEETLPAGAKDDEVFAKALELTSKLAKGPVQLAKHKLGANPEYLDVAEPWRAALHLAR